MSQTTTRRPLLLLHSAYGKRLAIDEAASALRSSGFDVHAPDLFQGRTADSLQNAMSLRGTIDIGSTIDQLTEQYRGIARGAERLALVGFSFGAALAQEVARRLTAENDTVGLIDLVLFHGCSAVPADLSAPWRVLGHFGAQDEFYDAAEIDDLRAQLTGAGADVELYIYPDASHLFTDPQLDEYHEAAATAAWARTLTFLGGSST
jgi:dienelactone hydrolase